MVSHASTPLATQSHAIALNHRQRA